MDLRRGWRAGQGSINSGPPLFFYQHGKRMTKLPDRRDVIRAARAHNLFVQFVQCKVLFKYEFSDAKSGKWALSYYPTTKRWEAPGASGVARDYLSALSVVLGPTVPPSCAAGMAIPTH